MMFVFDRDVTAYFLIAVLVLLGVVLIWRWLLPYSYAYRNATSKRHSWYEVVRNGGDRRWVRRWQIRPGDHMTGAKHSNKA